MLPSDWAVKLAEEVAPDEVELAPSLVEAFVAGGKARRGLFAQVNAQAGAFLPGDMPLVLPVLFTALASVSKPLLALLASNATSDLLAIVKNVLELVVLGKDATKAYSSSSVPQAQELVTVVDELDDQVGTLDQSPEKRAQTVLLVLRLLLENPDDGHQFVTILAERRHR